jgi:hypothetical protein
MTVPPGDPGPSDPTWSSLRIGDAERNAAADALQQHLTAGRLTLDEYADRSAVVMNARTQDEVDRVFGDLPPVAGAPGAAGTPAVRSAGNSALAGAAGVPPVPGPGRQRPSRKVLTALMGAMPIIALLLFLLTKQWYFFLLIPLAYAVVGPMLNNGGDDDKQLGRGSDH